MAKNKNKKPAKEDKLNDVETPVSEPEELLPASEPEAEVSDSDAESEKTEEMVTAQEFADLQNKYIRLVAEYDNFRKRTQKEKLELYSSSVADVVKNWLPVLDNLDRAVASAESYQNEESKRILEGIEMVRKQAIEVMKQLGVEEIDCLGKQFNPEYHDALAHIENPEYGENQIFEVIKKGYIKGDQVLRHSQVCVAN